jgi:hypothetical protein
MWHHERGESSGKTAALIGLLAGLIAIGAFVTGRTTAFSCTSLNYVSVTPSSHELIFGDDGYLLNQASVQQAAMPLVERGAVVSIYTFSPETTAYDRVEDNKRFKELLDLDSLADDPNLISVYLTCYKTGSYRWYTRWGSNWSSSLRPKWGEVLNLVHSSPQGDYTTTVTTHLYAIDRAISGQQMIPPTEIPVPTVRP